MYNESFARVVILFLYTALGTALHSCIVHPCHVVPHCPLMQCPPLPHRADLSTPAKSISATWCRIVHSCIVHSRKFSVPLYRPPIRKFLATSIVKCEIVDRREVERQWVGRMYPPWNAVAHDRWWVVCSTYTLRWTRCISVFDRLRCIKPATITSSL